MAKFLPGIILSPTDFSEHSTQAVQYARELAVAFQSRLIVLHAEVFEPPVYFTHFQASELAQDLERAKESMQEKLEAYVQQHIGGVVPAQSILVQSSAAQAILSVAEKEKADLIVMGSHGRSGWSRIMMGSVAERVIRAANHPVLVARAKHQLTSKQGSIQRILCAVDFTETSLAALDHAAAIAERMRAELTVMHAAESDRSAKDEQQRLCAWIPDQYRSACTLTEVVRHGNAAEQIIDTAKSLLSDLVVLGVEHKAFFDSTVIGTTAIRVTRHSPSPVLIVPLAKRLQS